MRTWKRAAGNTAGRRRKGWRGVDAFINVVPGDVVEALEDMGLDVLRVDESQEAHCRCPAHYELLGRVDKHPSFSVNIDTGLFGCWSCGFKGVFAELVAYVLKVDRADAVAWIRAKGTIRRVERLLAKKAPVVVDTTKLVNEASLALMVPPPRWALEDKGVTAEACARYGVLWEPQDQMWITPVRDGDGKLVGWQEKSSRFFRNQPEGLKKSKFLFGLQALPERCPRIVLVESPLDAVVLESAGIRYAVASYGSSVSDAQVELIKERTKHLVLFLDNDPPGRKSRDMIMRRWSGHGMAISTVDYRTLELSPEEAEGLDPGELEDVDLWVLVNRTIPASVAALTLR